MIRGIGIDIVQISRIQAVVNKHPAFIRKILTPYEQEQMAQSPQSVHFLAKRWAAKEACIKAIGHSLPWHDMEVTNTAAGKPELTLKHHTMLLSLSDEREYAVAMVIWVDHACNAC